MTFKVDFLIVGTQKGGTTSLHRYLGKHPDIYMPPNKELDFFSNEERYSFGVDFYSSFFTNATKMMKCGEASPQYMYYKDTPKKIHTHNPKCKIIMVLRNPIDRAYSHFRMNVRRGIENRKFENLFEIFKAEPLSVNNVNAFEAEYAYFELGEYGRILENYLSVFPDDQILILFTEELKENRLETINKVQDFIGVNRSLAKEDVDQEFHVGGTSRIPFFYKTASFISKIMPLTLKKILMKIFGRNNISTILHKIETDWNITKDKNQNEISHELRNSIASYYSSDYRLFTRLAKSRVEWEEFTGTDS